jgi:hypothetical protein
MTAKERVTARNSQMQYCSEYNMKMMEDKMERQSQKYIPPSKEMMKS